MNKTPPIESLAGRLGRPRTAPLISGRMPADAVKPVPLFEDDEFGRMIDSTGRGIELSGWCLTQQGILNALMQQHGAVLLRGFTMRDTSAFETVVRDLGPPLRYTYRSTPRTAVGANLYTSTEYPASEAIPLHNENAYASSWPLRIAFHCVIAAETGGATPIADSRKVFSALDKSIRQRFMERGITYVRNFGSGVDLSWQTAFQTDDKIAVASYCVQAGIQFEWLRNGLLRTWQVCPAVRTHPRTDEPVWFNQAHLFHHSALPASIGDQLLASLGENGLPRQAYYGDGTTIEQQVLAEIRDVYQRQSRAFAWQAGDVLLLDNMLTAHGRQPFSGARRVLVGMAEPMDDRP